MRWTARSLTKWDRSRVQERRIDECRRKRRQRKRRHRLNAEEVSSFSGPLRSGPSFLGRLQSYAKGADMNATSKGMVFAAAGLALALPIVRARAQTASAGPAQQTPTGPEAKKAEQVYKNIQVLKGIPADQVFQAMLFITASLGVQCDYCHVERAFEKDDKPPKQTARKMMQMMFAINKDNFDGHREVTCNSCHRGATDPVGTPIIAEEEPRPGPGGPMRPEGASPAANTPAGPSADQLIEKYVEALGGADALQKISSRVEKGTMTPFAGPPRFPIDVLSKAPDKRMSVVHLPGG